MMRRGPPLSPRRSAGFTLIETVIVITALAVVAVGILKLNSKLFSASDASRQEVLGLEIQRACAERLLAVRRGSGGLAAVQATTSSAPAPACAGLGASSPGFRANPTVTLKNAAGSGVTKCDTASASCTASITVATSAGEGVPLPALVLSFFQY